ncbi:MAG: DUF4265 domain-containing protein [Cyclobacteriaceae bacterium]
MTEEDKYAKILFKYHSNVLDEITVETMWAVKVEPENGIYRLDSIPFYGPLIATDDEFFAEYDESEQRLTYRKTTKHSGNSIVLVVIVQEGFDKEIIREEFKRLNCKSEGLNESYFSMEVIESIDYKTIQERLEELEKEGIIEYSEPCLSEKHRIDIN